MQTGQQVLDQLALCSEAVLCVFRSLCCLRRTRLSCQEEDVSSTPPSRCQPAPQWAVDPGAPRCWCCPPQVNNTPECDVTAPLSDFSFHYMFFDPLLAPQSRSRSSGATCGSGCCSACWWPPWSDCCSPSSLTAAGRRRSLGTEQLYLHSSADVMFRLKPTVNPTNSVLLPGAHRHMKYRFVLTQ